MKSGKLLSLFLLVGLGIYQPLSGQKMAMESISISDLKMHLEFLASDELGGRATGEEGLNIAAKYLAVQAEHLGLKAVNGEEGYFQHYIIEERSYDWDNCMISTMKPDGQELRNEHPFFIFPAIAEDNLDLSGEVVFAGYGIKDENFDYDDFENIDIKDKIVLIMNRAPMNEDGTESQFGQKWLSMQNFQFKMRNIAVQQPKAVFLVYDPKSGMNSIEDLDPDILKYISSSKSLKREQAAPPNQVNMPKMVLVHRTVADQILESTGKSLAQLQMKIDETLEPQSFKIEGQTTKLKLAMTDRDLKVPNVFGVLEGSDPVLKNEMVIYLAHFDHMGNDGNGEIFNGADDNGSGTVGLIEIAEAFLKDKKPPKRSIGFLWVSAEEIGLFGSTYFSQHPLVNLEEVVTVINLDMIGRSVTAEDIAQGRKGITIVGKDSVEVIGALQSKVLMEINEQTLRELGLHANYTFNNINHPDRYFFRSDHINFARKDIPVLFYSTGTHVDYHKVSDETGRIDFDKFQHMTRFAYKVGYNVANFNGKITVDNPMSEW